MAILAGSTVRSDMMNGAFGRVHGKTYAKCAAGNRQNEIILSELSMAADA